MQIKTVRAVLAGSTSADKTWRATRFVAVWLVFAAALLPTMAQAPLWKPPYEILNAPGEAETYASKLKGKSTAIWLEGDVLNVVHRSADADTAISGGLQAPMQRVPGSDLWAFRARMQDWDRVFFTYVFVSPAMKPGTKLRLDTWYGKNAPPAPVRTRRLRGRILQRTIHSDSLEQDRQLTVYLPPDAPTEGLPAFFLADGQSCEGFAKVIEPLILARQVRPVAIIGVHSAMPRAVPGKPRGEDDPRAAEYLTGYAPEPFARHMVFFSEEVPRYVTREFGVSTRREDRAVAGFSNGGGFAFDAAVQHPEVFGHALPFSASHGLSKREPKPDQPLPAFYFAAGELEYFHIGTKQFYDEVRRWNARATLELYRAGHDPEMWHMAFARFAPSVFPAQAKPQNAADSARRRTRFRALLERPYTALHPSLTRDKDGEFTVEHGRFDSEKGRSVPFLLYRPKSATDRLPAVIVLHGTGGSKEGMAESLRDLARRGLLAIAIDARYHGTRVPGGAHGAREYNEAILQAYRELDSKRQEHPFYYDTVYDLWRTVDYLQTRPDVDGKRVGMLGFSMGGIETWLAAASDTRIRVVVPAIGVQSLKWSLENERWQGRANTIRSAHEAVARDLGEPEVNARVCRALWNKVVPGILDDFDCPRMLEAIAPRPLLVVNGENDPNCPLEGAKVAFAAARDAYKRSGADARLEIDVAPGVAHAVTPAQREKAYAWLERWLKHPP